MNSSWEAVDFFERLISEYAGSKYAVAVDSCSHALFLSLKYCQHLNIECDTVSVPKQTYVSVPMQIYHSSYKLNFVENKWNGHYFLDPLPIVDSAQRFAKNMYIPDTYFCISFHSKKPIAIGKGGMILTDNRDAYNWFKNMRHDGRNLSDNSKHDITHIGYHMYMPPEFAIRGIELFYSNAHKTYIGNNYNSYPDVSKLTCFNKL